VEELQRWNGLEGTGLQVGQTLRVRPPRAASQTPTTTDGAEDPSTVADSATADPPTADTTAPIPPAVDSVTTDSTTTDSATTDSTTAAPTNPPPLYGRRAVEVGDSFVSLALRLGTTADTLYALNDSTAAPLELGETLRLPPRFAPPSHTVQPEETVYSIAAEYGMSARALRAANALDTTALQPGRRLRLPGREAPEVPPPGDWAAPDTTGAVAVYPDPFAGRLTASGAPYDPEALVASHPSLPYGSVVLLSRPDADRHTFARVVDRGPIEAGTLLDVSAAVAERLGIGADTTPTVALRVVWMEGRE